MSKLTLEMFTAGVEDFETRQYHVLQGLKETYDRFAHNRLYPDLADLIKLAESLDSIVRSHEELKGRLPGELSVDIEHRSLIIDPQQARFPELDRMIEFIQWAIPLIRKALSEAATIYNFVDEHISIEEVGIMPMYKQEGYWLVPDLKSEMLHLLRYEMALFSAAHERYRTLKTVLLESLEEHFIRHSPESVKLHLMETYADLPNPATYRVEVDIDFPYQDTILPIAKRKLMKYLVS
jgi:hypothetical protein